MDITLQIIGTAPTHITQGTGKWQAGEIVSVYDTTTLATWNGTEYLTNEENSSSRLVLVHITDVPTNLQKAKFLLKTKVRDGNGDLLKRTAWIVDHTLLPAGFKKKLLRDKQATVTWTQAKDYIKQSWADRMITDEDV